MRPFAAKFIRIELFAEAVVAGYADAHPSVGGWVVLNHLSGGIFQRLRRRHPSAHPDSLSPTRNWNNTHRLRRVIFCCDGVSRYPNRNYVEIVNTSFEQHQWPIRL